MGRGLALPLSHDGLLSELGSSCLETVSSRTMGDGVHASTAGRGAAIFWQPNSMAKGDYTISAMFAQTEPSGHPNAYGLVLRFINSLTFSSCTNRQKMAPYPYTTRTGSVSDAASEPLSNCAVGDRETDVDRSGGEIHAPVFRGAPRQDDSAGGRGLVQ